MSSTESPSPPQLAGFQQPTGEQPDAAGNQSRKKKWAPKAKTGCLTCRARRIKCDESKPGCKRCLSTGRHCQGYEDVFVTSSGQSRQGTREVTILPRPRLAHGDCRMTDARNPSQQEAYSDSERSLSPVSPEFDLPAFELDFMECARYYIDVVEPAGFFGVDRDRVAKAMLQGINRPRFIIHTTGEYIGRISRAHATVPDPATLPAVRGIWQKFHQYAIEVLKDVNDHIAKNDTSNTHKAATLLRIFSLINAELYTLGPSWRPHMIGFLTYVKAQWSFREALEARLAVVANMWVTINAVLVNSTSPSDNQIMPMYEFELDDIGLLFSTQLYGEMPCPTVLFLNIHRISELRMKTSKGYLISDIQSAAQVIFDEIESFDPNNWTERYTVPNRPEFPVLARTYKAALRLYGIMTMPPCISSATGRLYTKAPAREELLRYMREVLPMVSSKLALHWTIPVAGVALADGPIEDRRFIEYILMDIKENIEFYFPFHVRDTLRTFWESGSTAWDDCWKEPFPPLC